MTNARVRTLALSIAAVAVLATAPARAVPGGVVTSQTGAYYPGGNDLPAQTLRTPQGTELTYVNLDTDTHSVTSDGRKQNGSRLFDSGLKRAREFGDVTGVSALARGTYGFFCVVHPSMRGTLIVF